MIYEKTIDWGLASRISEIDIALRENWANIKFRFDLIRKGYDLLQGEEYRPYWFYINMTPIEENLWSDIREFGKTRLYPQYPVGRYFVDFGDPWKRLAIEADGAKYHQPGHDWTRDTELNQMGWSVYHIKGSDTFKPKCLSNILENHYM